MLDVFEKIVKIATLIYSIWLVIFGTKILIKEFDETEKNKNKKLISITSVTIILLIVIHKVLEMYYLGIEK